MPFNLKEYQEKADKLVAGLKQNEKDIKAGKAPSVKINTKASLKEAKAYKQFLDTVGGHTEGAPSVMSNLKEMLTSTDVIQMVPKIIQGEMIEAAEPEYLATNFFNKIQAPAGGAVVVVPVVGEIFAKEMGEGEPYNEDAPDHTLIEKSYLRPTIKKVGLRVSITEEALADYTWDIYNLTIRKMGQAFARFKEEKCMNEFSKHGHVVFDNDPNVVAQDDTFATSGLGEDGTPNGTLSVEDFLDLVLAAITNKHTPTDCIMHPLTWVVFARNSMIGAGLSWGALNGQGVHPAGGTQGSPNAGMQNDMGAQKFILRPEQVQNRLPIPLTMNFSPFVKFDKKKKLFDMYVLDRNDVGVIAQREEIVMDNWTDPTRDIQFLKARERYGVAIKQHGSGVMVARNLAVKPSYPKTVPIRVRAVED